MNVQNTTNQQSFGMSMKPFSKATQEFVQTKGHWEEGLAGIIEVVRKNQRGNRRYDLNPTVEPNSYTFSEGPEFTIDVVNRETGAKIHSFIRGSSFEDVFKKADNFASLCKAVDPQPSILERIKGLFGK